jgi:hypothetical protein
LKGIKWASILNVLRPGEHARAENMVKRYLFFQQRCQQLKNYIAFFYTGSVESVNERQSEPFPNFRGLHEVIMT